MDDVEANLVALEALLGDVDCDLVRAKSGNEGLRQLLKREFAVMLLDVQMPNMDGYEMAHYARENPETRQVPIIFLTAMNQTEDNLLQGYGSGAVDILYKPFSPMILRSKVRVFLELYNTRRKLADGLAAHQKTLVELKASRDELEQRHRALEQAQRDHRELTEFIVHDLKNPLSIAYAGLDWASEQIPPSQGELGQALADSREATMRLRSMIEDLLTISRMEQANFPLQRELLSVTRFLRSVVQGYAQRAQQNDIVLVPALGRGGRGRRRPAAAPARRREHPGQRLSLHAGQGADRGQRAAERRRRDQRLQRRPGDSAAGTASDLREVQARGGRAGRWRATPGSASISANAPSRRTAARSTSSRRRTGRRRFESAFRRRCAR